MLKAQPLLLILGLLFSSLAFSHTTGALVAQQQAVCNLSNESGLKTQMVLVRSLKQDLNDQKVVTARNIDVMFYESDQSKTLAHRLEKEYNVIKPDDNEPDRSEASLPQSEMLIIYKDERGLAVNTEFPKLSTEQIRIESSNPLTLQYTNKGFSYYAYVPMKMNMSFSQSNEKSFNLQANFFYSVFARDEKAPRKVKLVEKAMTLKGTCQSN